MGKIISEHSFIRLTGAESSKLLLLFIEEIRCCSSLIDTGRKLSICSNLTLHSTLFSVSCDSSDLEFIEERRFNILSKKYFENDSTNSLSVHPDGKKRLRNFQRVDKFFLLTEKDSFFLLCKQKIF